MVNEPGKLAGAQRAREKEKGAGQFAVPQREEEENYEKLLDQYGARKFAEVEVAYNENSVLRGRVVERIKGGLSVDIGVRAFLPGSQIDVRPVKNLDAFRGKEIECRVIKLNRKRGNIVLSRKLVLENEQARKKAFTLEVLREDAEVRGIVKNITDYGVFVDLGGIDGLLHVTDLSWRI